MWARQSTAVTLIVGPILDSAGAEYTSAVIGDLSLSKNGGTLTALAAAATLTHIANGQYTLVTTTGNLDTLGRAQITCNKSTYQMPPVNLMVVPAMVFDSMVLGTDDLDTNSKKWNDLTTVALPLVPTVAGRSLDVSATGEAGIDWANVGSPTTIVSLSATTIGTVNLVQTGAISSASFQAGAINASALATDACDEIADHNWDELLSGHVGVGSTGAALSAAGAAGDPLATAVPGAYSAGTAGFIIGTYIDAAITSRMATFTQPTGFLAATFPTDIADQSALEASITAATSSLATQASVDVIDGIVDAIVIDTNELQTDWANGGRLDLILDARASQTSVDGLNNLSAAQVNAEVLDVLNVDTFAEETGVPAATSSLRKKIGWMFMWFRNKVTQTGTTSTLFADDGTTAVGTHAVSDDATTFTSGEGT